MVAGCEEVHGESVIVDWISIEVENPGLSIRSVRRLGEGWNSRVFLVNDELVFRFPKRRENWEELNREIAFLGSAAPDLPLAVPRYRSVAPDSTAAPHGYAVYQYLPGHALDLKVLNSEKRATAAADIARFLKALHTLQPSGDLASRLPREDERTVAEEYLSRAAHEIIPKLPFLEGTALRRELEMRLRTPGNFSFRPVVLHADLSCDHILVEDDVVVAVLDFGDVNWGDPDYDFMYLSLDFGPGFAQEVGRKYGHEDLELLGRKLQYFSIVDQIGTILDGAGRALEGQQEAAWHRLRQLLPTGESDR
ncbi:MAG TPA: aminoglycoside phosphotransferase family protein [Terriglobales bacterium]|nr:aminoglycoside phosphotransferase family protein [Terriglobales bacterium]HYL65469.1 aminoglycoside phosphotransferase family protein [Candidatus Methylomirabilis sp.]